jgi:hypothetical protein
VYIGQTIGHTPRGKRMSDEAGERKAFEIAPIKRVDVYESILVQLGKRTYHQIRDEVR